MELNLHVRFVGSSHLRLKCNFRLKDTSPDRHWTFAAWIDSPLVSGCNKELQITAFNLELGLLSSSLPFSIPCSYESNSQS
jgi:hypothetical protein